MLNVKHHLLLLLVFGSLMPGLSWSVPIAPEGMSLDSIAQATPPQQQYNKGLAALSNNDLATAKTAFQESAKLDPTLYQPFLGMAEVVMKENQLKEAENWLQKALQIAPDKAEPLTSWGRFLYSQGRYNEADTAFKKAISLDANAFIPRLELAGLYVDALNKPKDAVPIYRQALSINPNHAGAHYALGIALAASGEEKEAIHEFEEASRLAPANPLPWQALGKLYAGRRQYDQALKSFDGALKAQPDFSLAYLGKGDVFSAQGKFQQAIDEYQDVLKLSPKFADAHLQLGMLYQQLERWDDAEKAYLSAVKDNPKLAVAYNNLAWIAAEQKIKLDTALTRAQKAIELAPAVSDFQDTLAWVHRARGELDKAASILEKANAMPLGNASSLYHLGVIYKELGKPAQARKSLEKALSLNNKNTEADRLLKELK